MKQFEYTGPECPAGDGTRHTRRVDPKTLPAQIRRAREARGLTRPQLAEQLGVSVKTVQNLETGEHPPGADRIADLERILEVKLAGEAPSEQRLALGQYISDRAAQLSLESYRALARAADVSPETVRQIIRGTRQASPGALVKLAGALRVDVGKLLELADQDRKPWTLPAHFELLDEGQRAIVEAVAQGLIDAMKRSSPALLEEDGAAEG